MSTISFEKRPQSFMLDLELFTLASREEHVAIFTVDATEGFLLVCVFVGYIIWQETGGT